MKIWTKNVIKYKDVLKMPQIGDKKNTEKMNECFDDYSRL